MDRVTFKSIPIYWEKEQEGLKSNTIREIDDTDERFRILRRHFENLDSPNELEIEIKNTSNGQYFVRKVTDIFFTNKNQVLISWYV